MQSEIIRCDLCRMSTLSQERVTSNSSSQPRAPSPFTFGSAALPSAHPNSPPLQDHSQVVPGDNAHTGHPQTQVEGLHHPPDPLSRGPPLPPCHLSILICLAPPAPAPLRPQTLMSREELEKAVGTLSGT